MCNTLTSRSCTDSHTLTITNTTNNNDSHNSNNNTNHNNTATLSKYLDVSLTAVSNTMNEEDRLRLIITINNDVRKESNYYNFEWSELNGHLTNNQFELSQMTQTYNYDFESKKNNTLYDI